MSYEQVIKRTKILEGLLVQLGATGKGLHEKLTSIEQQIGYAQRKCIRFVATMRNKLVHDEQTELTADNFERFNDACNEAEAYLRGVVAKQEAEKRSQEWARTRAAATTSHKPMTTAEKATLGLGLVAAGALWLWSKFR